MFPDYVYFYTLLYRFYMVILPARVCRVFVNSQCTDLVFFLPSQRVYQRFGSYVMNIHAPNLVP